MTSLLSEHCLSIRRPPDSARGNFGKIARIFPVHQMLNDTPAAGASCEVTKFASSGNGVLWEQGAKWLGCEAVRELERCGALNAMGAERNAVNHLCYLFGLRQPSGLWLPFS